MSAYGSIVLTLILAGSFSAGNLMGKRRRRSPHPPRAYSEVVVAVGFNIYAIGGSTYNAQPSSSVSILDCRSHTWHEAPRMRVERNIANANVSDGKIYVAGGCQDKNDSSNWMEVYDPKTQTWETLFCPIAERCISGIKSAVIEGERSSYCVIDNILYCFSRMLDRGLIWYDSNIRYWVNVTGLKGLPKIPKYSYLRLVCYGRKMAVFWDKNIPSSGGDYKTIWCAVITLEKRNNNEIWGNVESIDEDVLTVPSSYKFVCGLTATL